MNYQPFLPYYIHPFQNIHPNPQNPIIHPIRDSAWTVRRLSDTRGVIITHTDCDQCSHYCSNHLEPDLNNNPIPSQTIIDLFSHLHELFPDEYRQFIDKLDPPTAPNQYQPPAIRPTLADRMDVPPEDYEDDDETGKPDYTRMFSFFEKRSLSPFPPMTFSNHTNGVWVPNPIPRGLFPLPSPLFCIPTSQFHSIASFHDITLIRYQSMGDVDDRLRFRQASLNTDPIFRTAAMSIALSDHLQSLRSANTPTITTPPGLPEFTWNTIDEWIKNPRNTPHWFHFSPEKALDPFDVYLYFWITSVTWSRDFFLTNLLVILFSKRGAAFAYFWNNLFEKAGRPFIPEHPFLQWQFATYPNTAFRCDYYNKYNRRTLSAYTEFLVDIGHLPITNARALEQLCDWADYMLSGEAPNPFVTNQNTQNRRAIVGLAHINCPWIRDDGQYGSGPVLHFAPLRANDSVTFSDVE